MSDKPIKHQRSTSWDELGYLEMPNGAKAYKFEIGLEGDDEAPTVFKVEFPPNCEVAPHTHDTDYCEILLEGTQQITGKWHKAGDIRVAKAGTAYGPLVAGPEGCTVLVIFKTGAWPAIPLAKGDTFGLHVDKLTEKFSAKA
jgi:hypothetical protein